MMNASDRWSGTSTGDAARVLAAGYLGGRGELATCPQCGGSLPHDGVPCARCPARIARAEFCAECGIRVQWSDHVCPGCESNLVLQRRTAVKLREAAERRARRKAALPWWSPRMLLLQALLLVVIAAIIVGSYWQGRRGVSVELSYRWGTADHLGGPIEGLVVEGDWTGPAYERQVGTTDANGNVTFHSPKVWRPVGEVVFTFTETHTTYRGVRTPAGIKRTGIRNPTSVSWRVTPHGKTLVAGDRDDMIGVPPDEGSAVVAEPGSRPVPPGDAQPGDGTR